MSFRALSIILKQLARGIECIDIVGKDGIRRVPATANVIWRSKVEEGFRVHRLVEEKLATKRASVAIRAYVIVPRRVMSNEDMGV